MSGWIAITRDVFDHSALRDSEFNEHAAWIWMLTQAAWKPCKVRAGDRSITLNRGQLAFSIRFLATRWKWHRARVSRFLKRLESEDMIETATETGVNIITICNYDKFQRDVKATETAVDQQPRQERDKEEQGNNQQENIGGANAPTTYAFVGKIVRLKPADYDKWRRAYHGIPDLDAELTKADAYYHDNPPKDGKWFFPVSRWLDRTHNDALEKAAAQKGQGSGERVPVAI